jgi:ABC-2 type transport system ATP-binding protein
MGLLEIRNICKSYKSFKLDHVSFNIEKGRIVGFIGRNGAGKTTTLKGIYNLIHLDEGEILYEGKSIFDNELKFKSEIGLLFGEVEYYPNSTIKNLTSVTKTFYPNWEEDTYQKYLKLFNLDEKKKIKELSSGMKVKYGLSIALSHGAKVLILDEPTSGVDPVSRDELLDIFMDLVSDGEHSILFSTHVISDLEKCADDIVYIQNGRILSATTVTNFEKGYAHVSSTKEGIDKSLFGKCIYYKDRLGKFEGVIKKEDEKLFSDEIFEKRKATLEEIMVALERGE